MKLSKPSSLLIILALVFALLAGCGGTPATGDDEGAGSVIGDIAETQTPDATPKPTVEPTHEPATEDTPSPTPSAPLSPAPTSTPVTETPPATEMTPEPTPDDGGSVDLQAFFDNMNLSYDLSSLSELDSESLDVYYSGLTAVATKQLIAKAPMISLSTAEIVLVECEKSEDVETVKSILAARKQAQVDGGAWYPESIAIWENAVITSSGNYVMLICHEHAADIYASFVSLFAR